MQVMKFNRYLGKLEEAIFPFLNSKCQAYQDMTEGSKKSMVAFLVLDIASLEEFSSSQLKQWFAAMRDRLRNSDLKEEFDHLLQLNAGSITHYCLFAAESDDLIAALVDCLPLSRQQFIDVMVQLMDCNVWEIEHDDYIQTAHNLHTYQMLMKERGLWTEDNQSTN